jgi:aspartate aminotransferase-like enzyme
MVMLSEHGRKVIDDTTSTSFAADLRKWLQIMETYEGGGHAYHTTMPTDALARTRDVMLETRAFGFAKLRDQQQQIGQRVRAMFARHGIRSVAAEGFQAPGVVVSFTDDDGLHSARAFIAEGLQTASGVPLMCDEGADFKTFRVGLFGLEKLDHVERSVANLEQALVRILSKGAKSAA